jgi:predicted RNase H-like nuclease (RuvC/YqgF family)
MTRTPAEELERLVRDLERAVHRLKESEEGEAVFTKEDVDRIVSGRLAREKKTIRDLRKRLDEAEDEVESLRRELLASG